MLLKKATSRGHNKWQWNKQAEYGLINFSDINICFFLAVMKYYNFIGAEYTNVD